MFFFPLILRLVGLFRLALSLLLSPSRSERGLALASDIRKGFFLESFLYLAVFLMDYQGNLTSGRVVPLAFMKMAYCAFSPPPHFCS